MHSGYIRIARVCWISRQNLTKTIDFRFAGTVPDVNTCGFVTNTGFILWMRGRGWGEGGAEIEALSSDTRKRGYRGVRGVRGGPQPIANDGYEGTGPAETRTGLGGTGERTILTCRWALRRRRTARGPKVRPWRLLRTWRARGEMKIENNERDRYGMPAEARANHVQQTTYVGEECAPKRSDGDGYRTSERKR